VRQPLPRRRLDLPHPRHTTTNEHKTSKSPALGLALVRPGVPGLVLVMAVELCLITCAGVFNPVLAAERLERTPDDRVARTLSAWSVSTRAGTAALTALWGLAASLTGPRTAIAAAGVLLLATTPGLRSLATGRPSPASAPPSPAGPPPTR
ncbi:hypothetical protein ACFWN1_32655, partial [Streptomyces sp. NPDC058459]